MPEWLGTVLPSAAISIVVSGVIVWFFQTWIGERSKSCIKHEYDTKLEDYRAQLKSTIDLEVERHRVRFARLHEKRAEVIAELYSRLREATGPVQNYVSEISYEGGPTESLFQKPYAAACLGR
jgi:hypothetical protein